jgi:cyanobactin maturation PatA/PatG family protease
MSNSPDQPETPESAPQLRASACSCGSTGGSCTCGASAASFQLVFAIGTLGISFVSEQRRDSIAQHMAGPANPRPNPHDPTQLLAYLNSDPWEAAAVLWTLSLDGTTVYAVQPYGPFAAETYQRLRQFLGEQLTEGVERVSIPGFIAGRISLMTGQIVPVIAPELRCMYSWSTATLTKAITGEAPSPSAEEQDRGGYTPKQDAVASFLERVYELRDLGTTSRGRAINFAATNALTVAGIFASALNDGMQLATIDVDPSPIARPSTDCWDVKLIFFDPERQLQRARKVYRYTIDVSDVCPVMLGRVRSWSMP